MAEENDKNKNGVVSFSEYVRGRKLRSEEPSQARVRTLESLAPPPILDGPEQVEFSLSVGTSAAKDLELIKQVFKLDDLADAAELAIVLGRVVAYQLHKHPDLKIIIDTPNEERELDLESLLAPKDRGPTR